MAPRKSILKDEVEWLNSIKADLVVLHFNPFFSYFHLFITLILKPEDPNLASFTERVNIILLRTGF